MNRKIKILHIQETVHSGGVEKRRLIMAQYLNKEKYNQKLICTFAKGPIVNELENEGVEVIPIGCFKGIFDIKQYLKVIKIINECKPDIIHGAVFEGVTMACVCGFLKRVPVVIAEETSDPQNRSKKADLLLRLLCLFADKVVAISQGTEEYLKKTAKINKNKVHLINNGVELPRNVTNEEINILKKDLKIDKEDIVIGCVGRLYDDHKKITDIIKAISLLKDYKNIKLLIVGDGRDKEMIIKTAKDKVVLERLIMVGYQQDTSIYYQLMNVFCIASQREGFGLVAAEAMLNKLPVIATAVGGLKYIVKDGETGFLVPSNNPQAIAEKLEILIKDTELRKKMGIAGYEIAKQEYSTEVYVDKVDKMYQELYQKKVISKK